MSEPTVKAEIAAGGLVWDLTEAVPRLGLVHRTKYGDWTLPKGRFEHGTDHSLEDTARREVKEELGCDVELGQMVGATQYEKEKTPKVVLFWSMVRTGRFNRRSDEEIDGAVWLPIDEAIAKLTHASERDLIARQGQWAVRAFAAPAKAGRWFAAPVEFLAEPIRYVASLGPGRDRLHVAVANLSARLHSDSRKFAPAGPPEWFHAAALILQEADSACRCGMVDAGWGLLLEAERLLVFGADEQELIQRAIALRTEAKEKLKGWRRQAVEDLFSNEQVKAVLSDRRCCPEAASRKVIERAVFEGLWVLHGHYNNTYYRLRMARRQLLFLLLFLGALLAVFFWWLGLPRASAGTSPDTGLIPFVALFGGLGAVLSAVFQISRSADKKIPESILHGLITAGRPLVGAASALFLYMVLQSGLVNLIDPSKIGEASHLTLAFVAGFSERLILQTVGQTVGIVGGETKEGQPKTDR